MKTKATLKLGRINANEDNAKLVKVNVKESETFTKGALLLILETTKAAVEVLAPSDGTMLSYKVAEGALLSIGSTVFEAEFEGDIFFDSLEIAEGEACSNAATYENVTERRVSFKANELARTLGINPDVIPSAGSILKESDVRAYAERSGVIALDSANTAQLSSEFPRSSLPSSAMKAIIFGAGGHAKSMIQMIRESGYSVAGVVDSVRTKGELFMGAYPVLGTETDLKSIRASGILIAFVGVGGAIDNVSRENIFNKLKEAGFILPPIVSKMGNLDPTSHLGEATYVFSGATVGAGCVIGKNVIINQSATVCHDCLIEDHVHIAPGAILAGAVRVGVNSTIGMGATLMNGVKVGASVLVHNTVAVTHDVPARKVCTLKGVINIK